MFRSEVEEVVAVLEAEVDRANGVIAMLEHHWINPMEYYEAEERWRNRLEGLERIKTFVIVSAEFDDEGNSINDAGKLLDEIYGPDWDDLAEEMDAALEGGVEEEA